MRIMEANLLKSKFRGSLLGALFGDCCGAPFEGDILDKPARTVLRKYFDKLEGPYFKAPYKSFTDDTAMTQSVAKTLCDKLHIDQTDLARNFVKSYFTQSNRGYGGAVVEVFKKLRKEKIADPVGPAKSQFDGRGSYGNGAAMRVAPVALFYHSSSIQDMIEATRKSAEITHSHAQGINGAILQALAVRQAVLSTDQIDCGKFVEELRQTMHEVEQTEDDLGLKDQAVFTEQLGKISKILVMEFPPSEEEVINLLGHSVTALYSVPTAIYCFLKAQGDIPGMEASNAFRKAVEYAISLGGDADTIASMTGAISGAYHGDSLISEAVLKHCEASQETVQLADQLLEASLKNLKA